MLLHLYKTCQQHISLAESMCKVQNRMPGARGMPEHIQRPHVDNMEALKAPVNKLISDYNVRDKAETNPD